MFLALPIERPTTVPEGGVEIRLEAAESSAVMAESHPNADVRLKFGTLRSSLTIKYGLPRQLEVGLEIPFFDRHSGFLDPFVIAVENIFDYHNPDRDEFSDRAYAFDITRNGQTIISGEKNRSDFGDLVLSAKYAALSEGPRRPALSARLAIKFPTGDVDQAFGSGYPDVGIGLALQKTAWSRLVLYLNQNVVFPSGDFGETHLDLRPIYTTALAAEFLLTSWFSIVSQLDYFTTPFHGTGTRALDNTVFEIAFGVNVRIMPNLLWQLYAIENFHQPDGEAAADFTLATTVALRLCRKAGHPFC
jgi:hypothetical protein